MNLHTMNVGMWCGVYIKPLYTPLCDSEPYLGHMYPISQALNYKVNKTVQSFKQKLSYQPIIMYHS